MKSIFKKYPFEAAFTVVFIILAVRLNLMFLTGSNINDIIAGHDEYIAVKEIYSILHPASLKHFFMAFISGNALYYGRIMFYIDALVAWIPDKIWGIEGMVFSVRLFHSLLIVISIWILAFTFIKKSGVRWLFIVGSSCLYYTMYFVMMPKPEPMQLLCLAWFLKLFKDSGWKFGRHFILFGIAYGLKFNVLLILPIVFLVPLAENTFKLNKQLLIAGFKSLFFVVAGIVIAIPCLALTPLRPIFLKTYLHETFGGTEKTYDDASLDLNSWLMNGFGDTYLGVGALAIPFVLFAFVLLVSDFRRAIKEKDYSSPLLIISGLILMSVIMLKTKRLWPHYLWTAYILMLLGMLNSIDFRTKLLKAKFELTVMALFISSSFIFFIKRELPVYLKLEQSEEVVNNMEWSQAAIDYLNTNYSGKRIGTDGTMLYPFRDFVAVDRYHPFEGKLADKASTRFYWYKDNPIKIWDDNNDAVVYYQLRPDVLMQQEKYSKKENVILQFKKYNSMLDSLYTEDTSFGDIVIFKKQ